MTSRLLIATFHDYGAAHRAFCELLRAGVAPPDISIIAGDRSNRFGASRDFGILDRDAARYVAEVRRGLSLVALRVAAIDRAGLAAVIEQHAPIEIAERDLAGRRAAADAPRSA